MYDWNQYLNKFLETVTSDTICEHIQSIPKELGEIYLKKNQSLKGILYFNWNMRFEHDIDARREGNYGRDEIQIIFSINKDIEWYIEDNNQTVQLKKGEVCIYRNEDCTTSMCYNKKCSFHFKSLQIPTTYFNQLLSQYFSGENVEELKKLFLHEFTKTKITPEMYCILREIDEADKLLNFKALYLDGKIIELLSLLLHSITYCKTTKINRLNSLSQKDKEQIQHIKEQIDIYPEKEYVAENLAISICMSTTKLNRIFRQLYGTSIHSYVIQKRLEYAASLLMNNRYNVSEAAIMAGYTNLSHFSNSFRNKYGMLPKDYIQIYVNKISQ